MRFFLIIIVLLSAIQVSAQERTEIVGQQQPFQWVHYLSEVEKIEIGRRLLNEELRRREESGTLVDTIEGKAQELSFSASFAPVRSSSAIPESTAASIPTGNLTCAINIHNPHAGSGPNNTRVVKAKSSGTCDYLHTGPGPAPPTIKFELLQTLKELPWDYNWQWHVRNDLHPIWSASTAQIFTNSCSNGSYSHSNAMYITPAPGWTYTGPNPIQIPGTKYVTITNC